ncbi:hypothetical protein ACQE3E_03900 [Methylomonas sp. MED-D]|uniref:hypothetical protein n=1 Tax=Methylomonas sp. MED-D TaxID=3418768 RepID=UPI003D063C86
MAGAGSGRHRRASGCSARRWWRAFPARVWLVLGLALSGPAGAGGYGLPADADAVILRFDMAGGMQSRPADSPLLTLTAGGRLTGSAAWFGDGADRSRQLAPAELRALLTYLLADQRLPDLAAASIAERIRALRAADGRLFNIADAPTTRIELALPEHRHSVEFYAVDAAARQFPEIAELQRLQAIQNRLRDMLDSLR